MFNECRPRGSVFLFLRSGLARLTSIRREKPKAFPAHLGPLPHGAVEEAMFPEQLR